MFGVPERVPLFLKVSVVVHALLKVPGKFPVMETDIQFSNLKDV